MSCLCSRTANFHDVKGQLCGPQESEMEASEPKLHTGGGGGGVVAGGAHLLRHTEGLEWPGTCK